MWRNYLCLLVIAVKREPVPAATSLACEGSMAIKPSGIVEGRRRCMESKSQAPRWGRLSVFPAVGTPSRESPNSRLCMM